MKILIVSPYYNNSHFMEIQLLSFKKYLKNCSWKLLVLDDSKENTINVLTNTKENIKGECCKYEEVVYHKFPQNLHTYGNNSQRHIDVLNYMIQNITQIYKEDYDYILSFDADMCFIEEVDVEKEVMGYDIIGPKRTQWLSNKQASNSPYYTLFWVHCCYFNLKTIKNITDMKFDTIPNTTTDTGAMMVEFLYNNPQYKLKYQQFTTGSERINGIYKFEFLNDNKYIHYGTATLWMIDINRYKNLTYNQIFGKFKEIVINGLTTEQKKIIKREYEVGAAKKQVEYCISYMKNVATKNDLKKYKLLVN